MKVCLLAGGVGGARMAQGLAQVLAPRHLTVLVNVGDDEDFHGLRVCPDIDTVLYTLSGQINREQGWGVAGDTQKALSVLKRLEAADSWMSLGDTDLGLHLYRTQQLLAGSSLSTVTDRIRRSFGIGAAVLPITDEPLATRIVTQDGQTLRFQQWFVRERARLKVARIDFAGRAALSEAAERAIKQADLLLFAPSNPWLSIAPMLAVQGVAALIEQSHADKIAISPLIGGKAIKGPLNPLMQDLHCRAGNAGIADFYAGLADILVIDPIDQADCAHIEALGLDPWPLPTRIGEVQQSAQLAQSLLERLERGA
ncbi:hypothetical protein AXE65_04300 [Ventosimonas gracilis]|uniref:2-phospho-L-lactate transferase n=1 Tax=Ventosimonas gracilis TaxID=1680762 RepID=A0A139SQX2_9GAMM|nr:2-phospho-L-lactate transferase [Ventosimonas gracilis]KXU36948.1 hypothetical protein AXE65_04300 [Ventosimonas gracilis]